MNPTAKRILIRALFIALVCLAPIALLALNSLYNLIFHCNSTHAITTACSWPNNSVIGHALISAADYAEIGLFLAPMLIIAYLAIAILTQLYKQKIRKVNTAPAKMGPIRLAVLALLIGLLGWCMMMFLGILGIILIIIAFTRYTQLANSKKQKALFLTLAIIALLVNLGDLSIMNYVEV